MKHFLQFLFLIHTLSFCSQNNQQTIKAKLHPKTNILELQQTITYYNKSTDTLQQIVLRNWANSYLNDDSPLAKRLLEDYKRDFYFSNKKSRGYNLVNSIQIHQKNTSFHTPPHLQDIVYVNLPTPLAPNQSVELVIDATLKIPDAKFTGSGKKGVDYYLEDWHLTPAIYNQKWVIESHKNLNYQYTPPTNYTIEITTPIGYHIYSNFDTTKVTSNSFTTFKLQGKNRIQTRLSIPFLTTYSEIPTTQTKITTNFIAPKIHLDIQTMKMQQMMRFLKNTVGFLPQSNILIEKYTYNQNPIYELKYLPGKLHPFKTIFKWEAEFFKALVTQYIEQLVILNKVKDYWFTEGLQIYLFTKYINKYYPNAKIMGRLANVWGIRSMNIAKQNFTSKFSLLHQITARENLDQSLATPYDKLSNYNKKVISPYKAGIGFSFLKEYVGAEMFDVSIYQYISQYKNKESTARNFLEILQKNTTKDICWFQKEWINTKKKIDHKIVCSNFKKDSVYVTLQNQRSIKTPVLVYGLEGEKIKVKKWINGFEGSRTIAIKNNNLDKIVLNYQNIYPEINYRNNWDNKKSKLFERPIQVELLKDLNNPRKNQIFIKPEADYNYYDGVILGVNIQNKAYLYQNIEYNLKPTYSFASNKFTGGFGINYTIFPEKTNIYKFNIGLNGSNYHYAPNLNYNTLSPYTSVSFKQKNDRALGTHQLSTRFLMIHKEVLKNKNEEDKYNLLKLNYVYKMNKLIHNYQFNFNTEFASKFTKLQTDLKYTHLTNKKRAIELRLFGGVFLRNHTNSDYFSFNQHTANDYLFELPYLGRSETSGILSQQYFKSQGGFVTQNQPGFANQWLTSLNTNVGIYRWIEVFNNISLLKNQNTPSFFDYETGIRLNFIPNILEFYLPVYNKEGFVFQEDNYINKIRFVIILKAQPIVKFVKQQLF